MARAIRLARLGLYSSQPNPRVGCVIVCGDTVVGEGSHIKTGEDHAEIAALKQAGSKAKNAISYITLEPCSHTGRTPPCTEALIDAGVDKVIFSMIDPNPLVAGQGLLLLKQNEIEVSVGLLEEEAMSLNKGFIKRMNTGMPLVRCKLAMSIDGKTALATGESKWITGQQARGDVQKLRAQSCAIMTGIGTILSDDPKLTVREIDTKDRQPIRVIIDRNMRTPVNAKVLSEPGQVVIFTMSDNKKIQDALNKKGADVVLIKEDTDFLASCLNIVADKYEINEILLESGPGLSGAMIENGLVDEIVLYQAPIILGDKALGLFNLSEIVAMDNKIQLNLIDFRFIGDDIRYIYTI